MTTIFSKSGITKVALCNEKRLIKETYFAICDLSYNEFSIFYWQCSSVDPETPKGILDSIIVQDTLQLYECCKKFLWKNNPQTVKLLKSSIEITKLLFGKEMAYKVEEGQAAVLKDYLTEVFNLILKQTESGNVIFETKENMIMASPHINFEGILRGLEIPHCLLISQEKLKNTVCRIIEKDYKHFEEYVRLIMDSREQLKLLEREKEEILRDIVERGFVQVQSGYEHFFTLNKDPLTYCLGEGNEDKDEGKGIKDLVRKDLMV